MIESTLLAQLREMARYSRETGGVYAIPEDEGLFLHMLILMRKPAHILELGMSSGYSTIWLATAARQAGATVETVEYDAAKIRLAAKNFRRAGLDDLITIHHADANEYVIELENVPDFLFMDTEKVDYLHQFKHVFPLMKSGSVIAADNAVDLADDMADFLDYAKGLESAHSVTVPIGNGVELIYKK